MINYCVDYSDSYHRWTKQSAIPSTSSVLLGEYGNFYNSCLVNKENILLCQRWINKII